ncbi:hypothetical protein [Desulforamulus hydrothermalis]|uniref:Uncharacterized protein n=1 Tax=Desulforamulus hydrothermalis Lam5 = DSM 18033 TaxID=1121428 RepID=K8E0I9_9FIRM|nr:hypothetical protein [Desulforamulus hydrothermalis]CCO09082.1 conserved hypothetical protein [Desulforamulus hydrothermalis Lam5 = DSM 18033]SHG78598.1 hypothetical protein SAMN02745177_00399 [Desulforamulus hydrothermalis Lam5 = DSM 18033]
MAKLAQKDVENYFFKQAYDREKLRQAKYTFLYETVKDKRLRKMFKALAMTAQSNLAVLRQEMEKLDIN